MKGIFYLELFKEFAGNEPGIYKFKKDWENNVVGYEITQAAFSSKWIWIQNEDGSLQTVFERGNKSFEDLKNIPIDNERFCWVKLSAKPLIL